MSTWDSSIPPPLIADYTVGDAYATDRLRMSAGPDRVLRKTSGYYIQGNATVVVDKTGSDDFRTMLENTRNGADWIDNAPIDTGQGLVYQRIRISNVRWAVAGFVPGENWRISFAFEAEG